MSKWVETKLRGKIHVKHGFAFKGEYFAAEGEYIVLTPGNFYEAGGFKREKGKEKFYIGEIPEEYVHEKGDLIVAMTEQTDGLLGSCGLVPESGIYLHNQRLGLITAIGEVDKTFLYYLFKTKLVRSQLSGSASGTKVKHTSPERIYDLSVYLPRLNEQKKIAAVLSSIDQKIEINNRINAELEAMAKTLYDYWFVQFDFPDENGKPYKSSGGKMLYSKELKRDIPVGWEIQPLTTWIANDKSGDWGQESLQGNFTKKVTCIRGADINGLNGKSKLTPPVRYILSKNKQKLLVNHDLIIEISGGSPSQSTGRLAYITNETLQRFDGSIICSNFCKAISLKNQDAFFTFVYLWNRLYDVGAFFGWEGKTSGIKNLLFDSFTNSHKVEMPPDDLHKAFYKVLQPMEAKKQKILQENQRLAALRDWLLPMLMNGQVRVDSAADDLYSPEQDAGTRQASTTPP